MSYKEVQCSSWNEFKSKIVHDLFPNGRFKKGRFLFRGQGDASWALSPSFDRWYKGTLKDKVKTSDALLEQFKKECELEQLSDDIRKSDINMLSLGQNFGLPTRLLDWSESPYVSAFFAFSSHLTRNHENNEKVAIWVIDVEDPIWDKDHGCEIVNVPSFDNERIKNQHGKFTYLRSTKSSIEDYVAEFNGEGYLVKYLIPADDAVKALAELDAMGLSFSRIYPGITGNAMSAEVRVLVNL